MYDDEGDLDPFLLSEHIKLFLRKRSTLSTSKMSVFQSVSTFFEATARTLKVVNKRIKVEILLGSLNVELAKIHAGLSNRPADFPRTFHRMWLSNVPYVPK